LKKLGKILLTCLGGLMVLLAVVITFTIGWRPFIGPKKRALTNRQFAPTPERLARGRYLTQSLLGCETCHSPRDWSQHGAPPLPGKELSGQPLALAGFPGTMVAPNLTPDAETGAGSWSDDQLARAIREGITHDGQTLFPLMPYFLYSKMSDEDLASVVVYLRSVAPVRNSLPLSHVNFPVNLLVRGVPKPVTEPVPGPNPADILARGKYMVTLGCGCHNAVDNLPFAGGEVLGGPWGTATSANITPDASGISYYSEATFITALRTGYVGARKLSSIMPFGELKDLTDDDVKGIFAYLRTLPPVKHRVDNTLPPTYCKLCKRKHGAGDQN
jgi:mono/diheme cytochrome c family protein